MKLVFVHGAGGSGLSFYYQSAHFQGSDAVDLPGHPNGKPCTSIEAYTEWLHDYIKDKQYRDVVLVGHSMGGAIAQLYALSYPKELAGLILVGTGARLRVSPALLEECKCALKDKNAWLKTLEINFAGVEPTLKRKLMDKWLEIGPSVQLNDFLCCDKFDVMECIRRIEVPTLVINGTLDVSTPVKYASFLANNIPGASCTFVEGATHAVLLEKPEVCNEVIEKFVMGLSIKAGGRRS